MILKNTFNFLLIILSSLLVSSAFFTLSYLKIPFGWIVPFSLVPLFIGVQNITFSLEKQSTLSICTKSFILFWFFGLVVQLISFFWITKPLIYFGSVPAYLAIPGFVIMSILSSVFFPLLFSPFIFSLWYKNKFNNKKLFILPIACVMTLFEIYIPRFFDWSFGGLLSSNIIWSQLESLFGFNTGSLFIFYISLSFASILSINSSKNLKLKDEERQGNKYLKLRDNKSFFCYSNILIPCVVIVIVTIFGSIRVYALNKIFQNSKKFRVAFIQPNFTFNSLANLPLPSKDSQHQNFFRMLEMSKETIDKSKNFDGIKPDLLIWPESTAPDSFFTTPWQISAVTQLSKALDVPFLIQSIEEKPIEVKKYEMDNNLPIWSSSAILNSSGLIRPFFQKWIPMPFGEEFPLESKLPFLGKLYRGVFKNASKLERGMNYNALPVTKNEFITPLICFDSIDQELSYLSAKFGRASLFINQANFVWMVDSNAGLELALLDQMRAIENGKGVVVASNTGPSLAFDPLGQLILPPTELLSQNINFVDIPLYTGKTLFQSLYHWPLTFLGLFSLCYFIYQTRKSYGKL